MAAGLGEDSSEAEGAPEAEAAGDGVEELRGLLLLLPLVLRVREGLLLPLALAVSWPPLGVAAGLGEDGGDAEGAPEAEAAGDCVAELRELLLLLPLLLRKPELDAAADALAVGTGETESEAVGDCEREGSGEAVASGVVDESGVAETAGDAEGAPLTEVVLRAEAEADSALLIEAEPRAEAEIEGATLVDAVLLAETEAEARVVLVAVDSAPGDSVGEEGDDIEGVSGAVAVSVGGPAEPVTVPVAHEDAAADAEAMPLSDASGEVEAEGRGEAVGGMEVEGVREGGALAVMEATPVPLPLELPPPVAEAQAEGAPLAEAKTAVGEAQAVGDTLTDPEGVAAGLAVDCVVAEAGAVTEGVEGGDAVPVAQPVAPLLALLPADVEPSSEGEAVGDAPPLLDTQAVGEEEALAGAAVELSLPEASTESEGRGVALSLLRGEALLAGQGVAEAEAAAVAVGDTTPVADELPDPPTAVAVGPPVGPALALLHADMGAVGDDTKLGELAALALALSGPECVALPSGDSLRDVVGEAESEGLREGAAL